MLVPGIGMLLALWVGGCATHGNKDSGNQDVRRSMTARFASVPVKVDGVLDEAVWQQAIAYSFVKYPFRAGGREEKGEAPVEGGEARLAWDNEFLYVAVTFKDSDLVAEGKEDQLYHFKMGDTVEVFLKPADQTWYWELYATPKGNKSSFFIPGRGRQGLDSTARYECGLIVRAKHEGTLNHWEDKDAGWTAELAIPVKDLTARGEVFRPDSGWFILVSRYNYSRYLLKKEISTAMPLIDFGPSLHSYEGWAELRLEKQDRISEKQ